MTQPEQAVAGFTGLLLAAAGVGRGEQHEMLFKSSWLL
jgi:hypothetical protein